jgi:protein involved in polysaccharide export with SLBB domain
MSFLFYFQLSTPLLLSAEGRGIPQEGIKGIKVRNPAIGICMRVNYYLKVHILIVDKKIVIVHEQSRKPKGDAVKIISWIIVIFLAHSGVTGCGIDGSWMSIEHRMPPDSPRVRFAGDLETGLDEPYRLGPKDRMTVTVKRHPEFSGIFKVDFNGMITLPLLHSKIKVAGLTSHEITARIKKEVAPYVVLEPEVHVEITEARSRYYYVLGRVGAPGKYIMGEEVIKIREALTRAGLQSKDAATDRVHVIEPDIDIPRYVVVNAEEIFMGRMRYNITLKPGDIIFVPSTTYTKINTFLNEILRGAETTSRLHSYAEYYKAQFEKKR